MYDLRKLFEAAAGASSKEAFERAMQKIRAVSEGLSCTPHSLYMIHMCVYIITCMIYTHMYIIYVCVCLSC